MYVCVSLCLAAQNLELTGKCDVSQELAVSNDSNYYSSAENKPNVKHNGNVVYKVSKYLFH